MAPIDFIVIASGFVAALAFFWFRDKRKFNFPEEPGVYRVSVTRNQRHYNLFAYFDGMWWHEAKLTYEEALMTSTRAKHGYYWALCE